MTLSAVLIVAAALFAIGLYGALAKRNLVLVIMSLELMFNAVVVAALAFSRFTPAASLVENLGDVEANKVYLSLSGHVLSLFVVVVAAAETALGLALVFALHRSRVSMDVTEASDLRN